MKTSLKINLFKSLFFTCFWIFLASTINAEDKLPRICYLIPDSWAVQIAIEPALPQNYVLGIIKDSEFNIWGTQEDIATYQHNNPESIKRGVFMFQISEGVYQTGEGSLSAEKDVKEMHQVLKEAKINKYKWGEYPVLAVEGFIDNQKVRMAWIGLNSNEGYAMLVNFLEPKNENQTSKKRRDADELWENFIQNTKQLPEPEYFTALGMEMKDGYTIFRNGPVSLKVLAEVNTVKNEAAIIVQPLDENTTFQIDGVYDGLLGSNWKYGEPCLKVNGTIISKGKYGEINIRTTITILPKIINAYTFENNALPNVYYETLESPNAFQENSFKDHGISEQ